MYFVGNFVADFDFCRLVLLGIKEKTNMKKGLYCKKGSPGCNIEHSADEMERFEQQQRRKTMNSVIRAKVKVGYLMEGKSFNEETKEVTKNNEQISCHGVYDPDPESENHKWTTATPALSLTMQINNPGAFNKLVVGKEYYLDFIPVEDSK